MKFAQPTIATIKRISENRYTEESIRTLLLEAGPYVGPVITEFRHMMAHSDRDSGLAYEHLVVVAAYGSMFIKYQGTDKVPFALDKPDWWLKCYLLAQLTRFKAQEVRQDLGTTVKKLRQEIKSYFPDEHYPTVYSKPADARFGSIVSYFSGRLFGNPACSYTELKRDVRAMLQLFKIPVSDTAIEQVIVCMLVLLHGSTFILPNKTIGTLRLGVEPDQNQFAKATEPGWTYSPHGYFRVLACAPAEPNNDMSFVISYIVTDIHSEAYLNADLISPETTMPDGLTTPYPSLRLSETTALQFDSATSRPVRLA